MTSGRSAVCRRDGCRQHDAGFTRTTIAGALAVGAIGSMVAVHMISEPADQSGPGHRSLRASFQLPEHSFDATGVLTRTRREIHAAAGAPDATTSGSDTYQVGAAVEVKYVGDQADSLVVTWPQAALHERAMRRWLHLPSDGSLMVADHHYRTALFVGDDDRLAIEPDPTTISPHVVRASFGTTAHAAHSADLVRQFPKMPDGLRTSCRTHPGRLGDSLACTGFDGQVSYDLSPTHDPITLAILDVTEARSEEECRDFLEHNHEDFVPGRAVNTVSERTRYYESETLQAAYTWLPVQGFRTKSSCSIVSCLRSDKRRTPCTPP